MALYDLLDSATFLNLSRDPARLVVIDEIQRLPELLNEVHRLIEERQPSYRLERTQASERGRQFARGAGSHQEVAPAGLSGAGAEL